jgi:hypothetical protein
VDQYRRTGELRASARRAFEAEMVQDLRTSIEEVMGILDGKAPPKQSVNGEQ